MDSMLSAQYAGKQNPRTILVYSQPGRCYMVRLKPKDKRPSPVGLTAIFTITYHAKR
jgi:hypothetical protein